MTDKHVFAICAYKESPYLEKCIRSVKNQTVPSEIILATATPCTYISGLCRKYKIPCLVNEGGLEMIQNWNFAYSQCENSIITIVHQDDVYSKKYTEKLLEYAGKSSKPLIFFSDYFEIRNGELVTGNPLLWVKRFLLFAMRFPLCRKSIFLRRRILSLGSPICCPSVAFFQSNLPEVIFHEGFRSNMDWDAWERISKRKGEFLYCREPLVAHRIHENSETSNVIRENVRTQEDFAMYRRFWPDWIARRLCALYQKSEKSNKE